MILNDRQGTSCRDTPAHEQRCKPRVHTALLFWPEDPSDRAILAVSLLMKASELKNLRFLAQESNLKHLFALASEPRKSGDREVDLYGTRSFYSKCLAKVLLSIPTAFGQDTVDTYLISSTPPELRSDEHTEGQP